MDLDLSAQQIAWRDMFRAWLDANLPAWFATPQLPDDDEAAVVAAQRAWERELHAAGYAGIAWPREYGGQGLTAVEQLIVSHELGLRGARDGVAMMGSDVVGPILIEAGTEGQKSRFLARMARLDDVWCLGFSEPNAGSDLASLKTRAVRDGEEWVITGQKVWTSNAHHADMCLLLARTEPGGARRGGFGLFLVDMTAPGISTRPIVQITGAREFNDVFFENVRVRLAMRIGTEDDGWDLATRVLELTRANTPLHRNGNHRREFDELVELCRQPGARGDRPIDNPHYRQRLAEILADLEIHRYHNLKAAGRMAMGARLGRTASIAKLLWSETHQRMSELALDVLEDAVCANDGTASHWRQTYLRARADTIFAGTSEIQRNIVAEQILGLPR